MIVPQLAKISSMTRASGFSAWMIFRAASISDGLAAEYFVQDYDIGKFVLSTQQVDMVDCRRHQAIRRDRAGIHCDE